MEYHIGQDGQRSGPYSEEVVRAKIAEGTLHAHDMCWSVGWNDWKTVGSVFPTPATSAPATPSQPPAIPPMASLLRIEGKALVAPVNFEFPAICLKTGVAENLVPKSKSFYWHHPAVYFVILLNLLAYLVVALVIRKRSQHRFYVSQAVSAQYRNWLLINWGIFFGSIGALVTGISLNIDGLFVLFMVGLLLCTIAGFTRVRMFYPAKIDKTHIHLCGIPPEVMQKLVDLT